MKRDGLLTGLVLGGVVGLTISLLVINASKSGKKEKDAQDQDWKGIKIPEVQKVEDSNKKPSQNSEETVEKENNKKEETRNTEREKKKAEKEGTSFGEDIVSKLNFSKKIAQLEESLKKLREENV